MALNMIKDRRRGVTSVEAAIVFPILLLLTFGCIEYGWLFLKQMEITNAVRHGARVGVRADATSAQIQTAVTGLMTKAGIDSGAYAAPTITPGEVKDLASGTLVTVTLTLDYSKVGLMKGSLVPVPAQLHASATMAKEGP